MKEKRNKNKMQEVKNILEKTSGITLIALIITIIVLLILAAVSINMVLGDGGIISQAELAVQMQENSTAAEEEAMNELLTEYESILEGETEEEEEEEKIIIDTDTSYVSYYADVDGDGTVDGIIFADLAIGGSGNAYSSSSYSYSYDAVEDISSLKEYYISEEGYEADFGTYDVITTIPGTSGENRFYVLALTDLTEEIGNTLRWYKNAYTNGISDYSSVTSKNFGTGLSNTLTMLEAYQNETYGTASTDTTHPDIWSLTDYVGANVGDSDSVWFLPSVKEFCACAGELGLETVNASVSMYTWTSSLMSTTAAYKFTFTSESVSLGGSAINNSSTESCRLATIF